MPLRISTGTDTDRGIAALVHELTDDANMSNVHGWKIDRAYGQPDRLTVTFIVDSKRLDQALAGHRTVAVPRLVVPVRDDQPRPDQDATLIIGAATAGLQGPTGNGDADLRAISHAPTTCIYPVRIGGSNDTPPCGELIRWTGGEWVHVSDPQLGQSDHPATPGQ